ncbi:MAG: sugar ABC transporter permease [Planctomycetota bacterium]|jgi:multiple sugar transport system permease protein|nr:sugar ABC transporter permease [Planctomycetota bacterium]
MAENGKSIWRESGLRRERWHGYYFLIPGMALIAVLISVPLIRALWTSLHRVRGFRSTFIGLDNYIYLLSKPDFWHSLRTSALFTTVCVALHTLLGLGLALLLNRIARGKTLMRVGFLAPWIVAPSIGAIIWVWLLEPQFGVVNHILSSLGLIDGFMAWLGEPDAALLSVIVVDVWRGTPFVMLILLAGLQGIPKEQYEAAAMDGAGPWQQFRHVTLPNLHYLLVVASTLDIISTIRHFDVISVMTGGGPVRATEVLPVMIYNTAFVQNDFGRASAAGVMLLGIILIFSMFYLKATKPGKARED